jgi:phosphoglycerate dehydrogenase-like enzyme
MLRKLVVTAPVSEAKLEELRGAFEKVTYHPDGQVDAQTASEADIWYTTWLGLPKTVTSLDQVPNTKAIQLSSGMW